MSTSTTDTDLAVQILHVPDCPNVETLRAIVQGSLTTLGLTATIEEIEGPYPSPTLVINGIDVNPRSDVSEPACRLDLPTEAEILDALTSGAREPDGHDRQEP